MKQGLALTAFGHATSVFLAVTFALCVAFDLLFPNHAMFKVWQDLLPGFQGLNWKSFAIGLAESYIFGWYIALIWVPIYNVAALRRSS